MGAHSFLCVGDLWMFAIREGYSVELTSLFTDEQADPASDTSFYRSTVGQARDRLNCLGITGGAAAASISQREKEVAGYFDRVGDQMTSFDEWLATAVDEAKGSTAEGGEPPEWTFALDPRITVRPLLDHLPEDVAVELDLTEIVGRDWASVDETRCASALELGDTPGGRGPMIVMTEGGTDAEVVTAAIEVLAPHLGGCLRVLDYTLKPEGGAPALVRGIRAFAAAGIRNNIVALFDNDTAASSALRPLRAGDLPKNIRVVRLPDLEIARAYPTLGPSGPAVRDVNGDASAIEMFLGEDVLRIGGDLAPVQWMGWMDGVNRYQGELTNKAELHRRFRVKVERALADGRTSSDDWAPLELLLRRVVGAFEDDVPATALA